MEILLHIYFDENWTGRVNRLTKHQSLSGSVSMCAIINHCFPLMLRKNPKKIHTATLMKLFLLSEPVMILYTFSQMALLSVHTKWIYESGCGTWECERIVHFESSSCTKATPKIIRINQGRADNTVNDGVQHGEHRI